MIANHSGTSIDFFLSCDRLSLRVHLDKWKRLFVVEKDSDAFEGLQQNKEILL